MDLRRCVLGIMFVLLAFTTVAVKPINSSAIGIDDWAKNKWNNLNSKPQVKYLQLFNRLANAYVRIRNTTVDVTTTNNTDPDTYLQIDMFGRTLTAIRSYQTGKYVCHNPTTGHVEIKVISNVSKNLECVFYKINNEQSYHSYRSGFKQQWYFAFYGKGNKKGKPKKGSKSSIKNKGSMYLEMGLKHLRKRTKG